MIDLFGNDIPDVEPSGTSQYIRFKQNNAYRESVNNAECCKTCAWLIKSEYHDKNYYKCELMGVSSSEATDIRLKNVCNKWKKG